jgi:putative protease
VVAAVQSGADAIYMGHGSFNARRSAKNFTDEEFDTAVRYCRVRGCKVYLTLNTLVSDREMPQALQLAVRAAKLGCEAFIVQDLGMVRDIRCILPDMPIHASTQMSVHNLAGVLACAEMGITRVVLARELSIKDIRFIASRSPIELEVFVHGALCFCHSGQCYMSGLIGGRSGNRGLCAQPCRLQYSLGGRMDDYPLSLKDNCLVEHLTELEEAGVACVKIEGRMKRPDYTAIATGVYARAIKEKQRPTDEEMDSLELAFSRQGFTDGYYKGEKGPDMFGVRLEPGRDVNRLYTAARRAYAGTELRRAPVKFYAIIKPDQPSLFAVEDTLGNKVVRDGPMPQKSENISLSQQALFEQLYKTGGTPYLCKDVESIVEDGLFLPASAINEVRRSLLEELSEERKKPVAVRAGHMPGDVSNLQPLGGPKLIFQVTLAEQLTEDLAALDPGGLYVPLTLLVDRPELISPFTDRGVPVSAVLPRVITDGEYPRVIEMLKQAAALGIKDALVGNMGHIRAARAAGLELRGDFGLNVFNSDALQVLNAAGFISATASFELRLAQIRDMRKPISTEMLIYGRMPLMVTDQCIIKNSAGHCNCKQPAELRSKTGQTFYVTSEFGHRNVIFNAHKLFMADRLADVTDAGVWGARLLFSSEGPQECVRVAESYLGPTGYVPNAVTRGLYYRGVE